jgi:hypothetical protein
MSVFPISRLCIFSGLGFLALVLTGCALSGNPTAGSGVTLTGSGGSTVGISTQASLGGKVYGGQHAVSAATAFVSQYDNESELAAAGYVPSTGRGSVSIQMNGATGAQYTAWAVLSDPATNFQVSCNGLQYWADIGSTGSYTFTGVAPGTYRLSVYVLGQWGEYRQDSIVVTANNTTTVPAATWVPENFGGTNTSAAPATTGWNDYTFLNGTTTLNNDAVPNP